MFVFISAEFKIVYPEIVKHENGFVVNDVKKYVRRSKRTLGNKRKPLEISISGGDELFELELWENDNLFADGFKIYHRQTLKQSQEDRELPHQDVYGCFFTGHVKEKSKQSASISICNGLVSTQITKYG